MGLWARSGESSGGKEWSNEEEEEKGSTVVFGEVKEREVIHDAISLNLTEGAGSLRSGSINEEGGGETRLDARGVAKGGHHVGGRQEGKVYSM